MKRILSLLLACLLVLSMAACGAQPSPEQSSQGAQRTPDQGALTVRRGLPLANQVQEVIDSVTWLETVTESILVDDIPVLISHRKDDTKKPVYIAPHEQGCSKEHAFGLMPTAVSDLDAIFVSFDMSGLGDSSREYMSDEQCIQDAVADLDKLLDYCSTLENADMNRIVIEGWGMGADMAIAYLKAGRYTPAVAVLCRASGEIPEGKETVIFAANEQQEGTFFQERADLYTRFLAENMSVENTIGTVRVNIADGETSDPALETVVLEPVAETAAPTETVPETTAATAPAPADNGEVYEVTLTVERNRPLTDAGKEAMEHLDPAIKPESIMVDGISAYIAYRKNGEKKPVYIYCHGSGGGKEEGLRHLETIVNEIDGIYVSFDMPHGGERSQTGTVTGAEIICGAVPDIDKLLAFCSTIPEADLNQIYLEGMSGGAASAEAYMTKGVFTPVLLMVEVPCFDFSLYGEGGPPHAVIRDENDPNPPLTSQQINAIMEEHNPYTHAGRMMNTYVLAAAGLQGHPDVETSTRKMEQKFREMGKTDFDFRYYEGVDHNIPEEYYEDARDLMQQMRRDKTAVLNPSVQVTIIEK